MYHRFDINECLSKLAKCEALSEQITLSMCNTLVDMLTYQPNVAQLYSPLTIVGDIQGQYYDLIEIFNVGGSPPDTNYLFLGDFVNRGYFSVESVSLLICLKIRFPDRITLIRGKEETRANTKIYGFYNEVIRKYGNPAVYNAFMKVFDFLPIAALISNDCLCVHSGISENAPTIDSLRILNRFQPVTEGGIIHDICNSCPDRSISEFDGLKFGQEAVQRFLQVNNIGKIARSGEMCMDGYQVLFEKKLYTIWSAPNFWYRCGNVGAILELTEDLKCIFNTYLAAPDRDRKKPNYITAKEHFDYY
eukprot:TRINITY_DN2067_c0_g4_i1.p1 TRINITY_DN2067_c0_g4~~TRINITY_DN2067_c0_g4_i1.p1  ORF type:complete len:305 (-),score=59.98 TRINITY_DN2067_c0_g4_i1:25-939(-)